MDRTQAAEVVLGGAHQRTCEKCSGFGIPHLGKHTGIGIICSACNGRGMVADPVYLIACKMAGATPKAVTKHRDSIVADTIETHTTHWVSRSPNIQNLSRKK